MICRMAVQSQISDETLASMLFPDLPLPIKPVVDLPAKGKYHNQDHTNELFSGNSTSHENTKENKDVAEILDKDNKGRIECGWRGYEREEKEGEREVDNLSTCGCVIQLYLWENARFIEIREFGWGF